MRDGDWSWMQFSAESFPKLAGKPHFLPDLRTCILPVALESGRSYAIGLDTPPGSNFQDRDGRKAYPYLLVFGTAK